MKQLRFWVGIGISVVCLALAVRDVRLDEVMAALSQASYPFVLLTVAMTLSGLWMRAVRWRLLFYPKTDLPLGRLFTVLNIGYLLMNVLPARLGDVARAYLLGDLIGVSKARTLSTIFVERMADVLVVLLFLASLVLVMPVPEWAAQTGGLLAVGFLALTVFLVALARNRVAGVLLAKRVVRFVPWLDRPALWHLLESLLDGIEILRYWRPAVQLLVISIFIWILGVVQFDSVLEAFGLGLPIYAAVFIMCVTALGMTVPSSPGYIGVWEYIIVLALGLFGVDKSLALSYALVLHGTVYLTTTVAGLISLWSESLAVAILREEVLPQGKTGPHE